MLFVKQMIPKRLEHLPNVYMKQALFIQIFGYLFVQKGFLVWIGLQMQRERKKCETALRVLNTKVTI